MKEEIKPILSEKHQSARDSLPEELKPVFDDLVTDYKFFAMKHHGSRFVSYAILADLIRNGWRLDGRKPLE
jgi:hypothetical protein